MKKYTAITIALMLALALSSCGASSSGTHSQSPITPPGGISVNLPDTEVLYTENFSANDKVFAYTVYSMYSAFCDKLTESGMTPADVGITVGESLAAQSCSLDSSFSSWLEMFSSQAEYSLTEQLVLAEAAKEAGITLNEEDEKSITSQLDALSARAAAENKTLGAFLTAHCGAGVTPEDVRNALSLSLTAEKYLNEAANGADTSRNALESYYFAHESEIDTVDFLVYVFASGEEKYAETLAGYTSPDDFTSYLKYYVTTVRGLGEDEFDEIYDSHVLCENVHRTDSNVIAAAFGAKSGECVTLDGDGGTKTVILVTRSRSRNKTKNEDGVPMWEAEVKSAIENGAIEDITREAAAKYTLTRNTEKLAAVDIKA